MKQRRGRKLYLVTLSVIFGLLSISLTSEALAFTTQWLTLDESSVQSSGDFALEWQKALPGWDIVEGRRSSNQWTASGSCGQEVTESNFSKIWIWWGEAKTGLSVESDSVVFLMAPDNNDGHANFYVDELLVASLENYDPVAGAFYALIVSGLSSSAHTLKVQTDGQPTYNYDVAIIGGGAISPSSTNVPIPGAIWLLGSGLVGVAGLRRNLTGLKFI